MRTIAPLQQQTLTSPIQNKPRHTPSDRATGRRRRCSGNARPHSPGRDATLTSRGTAEDEPPTHPHHRTAIVHRARSLSLSLSLSLFLFLPPRPLPQAVSFSPISITPSSFTCAFMETTPPPPPTTTTATTMTVADELTSAAAKGRTADVELLLRGGAEVNGLNRFGRTALQAYIYIYIYTADEMYTIWDLSVNIFSRWKVMMMGSTPVARVLLKHGADPNVADGRTGSSPLHDAAREGFVDTARLLVEHLADPQARDNAKCRPVDLARDNGHDDVVAFLESL
ncbi:hypothetical protein F2P81_010204 [Scophthalmus maximus]|uniref:Uncharacterized protein n=1 Tax=Scophthalmus maximus TaxID=52904 RepID=A0A6A4SZU2_SCOMX|nr:hypothetical protein F2P81_010204 [Scophthalmus maximus]